MQRKIITIDADKCNGCGKCMPNCPEGALQIIDGKARLVSDLFCDGLGACIGHCPEGAMLIEEREAELYDETRVMENVVKSGANTIKAHLIHLYEHGEESFLNQAIAVLENKKLPVPDYKPQPSQCGCPGSKTQSFAEPEASLGQDDADIASELRQWPIQLNLLNPNAPYFENADILVAADCVAFATGNFQKYLRGKKLVIFCPKLDTELERYVEKLSIILKRAQSVSVMHMEVPCCFGTMSIVEQAIKKANVELPLQELTMSLQGQEI